MWASPAVTIPIDNGDEDEKMKGITFPWAGADLTDLWWTVVHSSEDEWTEFFPGTPREPKSKPTRPIGQGQVLPYRSGPDH